MTPTATVPVPGSAIVVLFAVDTFEAPVELLERVTVEPVMFVEVVTKPVVTVEVMLAPLIAVVVPVLAPVPLNVAVSPTPRVPANVALPVALSMYTVCVPAAFVPIYPGAAKDALGPPTVVAKKPA